ncbi:MAG: hypothetical protein OEZ22_10535 [Spirochaetia bacterium]|nr:hypothetical protein [Spirochaetia bacterium]
MLKNSFIQKKYLILIVFNFLFCVSNVKEKVEYIHPVVDLQIVMKTDPFTYYEISFWSDNREDGFKGFGFFTGETKEEAEDKVNLEPVLNIQEASSSQISLKDDSYLSDILAADAFCEFSTVSYIKSVLIQAGGASKLSGYRCYLPSLNLTAGNWLSIRAFAKRDCTDLQDCSMWSVAAVQQIP